MYLVIGPREKGYWVSKEANKETLLHNLNSGYYKNRWDSQGPDLEFVEELPKILENCATMDQFNPNQVMIVECKVVTPKPVEVTTKYELEEDE